MKKTLTGGNVIVEDIEVGDIHWEFEGNLGVKTEVVSLPRFNKLGQWEWESKHLVSGEIIEYLVDPKYQHYAPKLYDHEAYSMVTYV